MQIESVTVDGTPASFRGAEPTHPGDPHGPHDPGPRAHEASQTDPVGRPGKNPLPPECQAETAFSAQAEPAAWPAAAG